MWDAVDYTGKTKTSAVRNTQIVSSYFSFEQGSPVLYLVEGWGTRFTFVCFDENQTKIVVKDEDGNYKGFAYKEKEWGIVISI